MSKLEELRSMISKLFEDAESKEVISTVGAVTNKIDEIEAETKAKDEDYKELLKDYKDVVIHSSFKPDNKSGTADGPSPFNANNTLEDILSQFDGK